MPAGFYSLSVAGYNLLKFNLKEFKMNIYVGNLASDVKDEELKDLFSQHGRVDNVKIIRDMFSQTSKGFGFVEMPSNSEADQAIKALNGKVVEKMIMKVNHADPGGKKKKKPFRKKRFY